MGRSLLIKEQEGEEMQRGMQLERWIKEKIYIYKRINYHKMKQLNYRFNRNILRGIGGICILLGLLLILSQCNRLGNKRDGLASVSNTPQICYSVKKIEGVKT